MNGEIFKQLMTMPTRPLEMIYYGMYLHLFLPTLFKMLKLSLIVICV